MGSGVQQHESNEKTKHAKEQTHKRKIQRGLARFCTSMGKDHQEPSLKWRLQSTKSICKIQKMKAQRKP